MTALASAGAIVAALAGAAISGVGGGGAGGVWMPPAAPPTPGADVLYSGPESIAILQHDGLIEQVGSTPDGRPIYKPAGDLVQFNDNPQWPVRLTHQPIAIDGTQPTSIGAIAFNELGPGGTFTDITIAVNQGPAVVVPPPAAPDLTTPPVIPDLPPLPPPPPLLPDPPPPPPSGPLPPPPGWPGDVPPPAVIADPPTPPDPGKRAAAEKTRNEGLVDKANADTSGMIAGGLEKLGNTAIWIADSSIDLLSNFGGAAGQGVKYTYDVFKGIGSGLGESMASGQLAHGDLHQIVQGAERGLIEGSYDALTDKLKEHLSFWPKGSSWNWAPTSGKWLYKQVVGDPLGYISQRIGKTFGGQLFDWQMDKLLKNPIGQGLAPLDPEPHAGVLSTIWKAWAA